jgi:ferredoxin
MKVRVDRERCEGHGQCNLVSDELFPVDDAGYSAIETGGGQVPAGDEDVAEEGVYNCPARALVLDRD